MKRGKDGGKGRPKGLDALGMDALFNTDRKELE